MTQETFARAWRSRGDLANKAAARSWLLRIATNACLDSLRGRKRNRRLWADPEPHEGGIDLGAPALDIHWLEPMSDSVLANVADDQPGPHARYEQAEAVRLAFLACVQLLPARQRAVFLLREVLGWSAAEAASALEMSPQAANSQLQRARRTFGMAYQTEPEWSAANDLDQRVAESYAAALQRRDIDAFTSLLLEDATMHMPPWRTWVAGRTAIYDFMGQILQRYHGFRTRVFRANGRCAIAVSMRMADDPAERHAVHVLEICEGAVVSVVAYVGPLGTELFSKMGLSVDAPQEA